jgi:hypothetical protein
VSTEDKKSHFHHDFTTLRIKENESATAFLKRFIFAKTKVESAGNTYSEQELVSFAINSLNYPEIQNMIPLCSYIDWKGSMVKYFLLSRILKNDFFLWMNRLHAKRYLHA